MRIKVFLFALLLLGSLGITPVFSQDEDTADTTVVAPPRDTIIIIKTVIWGRRVNPGREPAVCDLRYPNDTCAVAYSVTTATGTTATQNAHPTFGIYLPSDNKGYVNVGIKLAYNYKEYVVSIVREKDTKEVASEHELETYFLRPEDKK